MCVADPTSSGDNEWDYVYTDPEESIQDDLLVPTVYLHKPFRPRIKLKCGHREPYRFRQWVHTRRRETYTFRKLYCSKWVYQRLRRLHKQSIHNKKLLLRAGAGVCFRCGWNGKPADLEFIAEWRGDATAWCRHCGIDSIVPATPFARRYITQMELIYFENLPEPE